MWRHAGALTCLKSDDSGSLCNDRVFPRAGHVLKTKSFQYISGDIDDVRVAFSPFGIVCFRLV